MFWLLGFVLLCVSFLSYALLLLSFALRLFALLASLALLCLALLVVLALLARIAFWFCFALLCCAVLCFALLACLHGKSIICNGLCSHVCVLAWLGLACLGWSLRPRMESSWLVSVRVGFGCRFGSLPGAFGEA